MRGSRDCTCQRCGITFRASRADAKFCSQRCRQRVRNKPRDFRSGVIAKALRASGFLIGRIGPAYGIGHHEPVHGLMVPRAAALGELNCFIALPEPFTDAELVAVLRAERILDYGEALPKAATGVYAKRAA